MNGKEEYANYEIELEKLKAKFDKELDEAEDNHESDDIIDSLYDIHDKKENEFKTEHGLIFEYSVNGSFSDDIINSIKVFDREEDNVILESDLNIDSVTISKVTVNKIMEIINENKEIFEIQNIENPPVDDGNINEMFFSNGVKGNSIMAFNLWYYEENNTSKNAEKVLKVFNLVKAELLKLGITENYLKLR